MRLKYVVITSVDHDDLRDGGAQHFAAFADDQDDFDKQLAAVI